MPRPAFLMLLTAGLAATLSAVALPATSAGAAPRSTVHVHGRLLVLPSEQQGVATRYAVALADGDIVRVRGSFDAGTRTGALFDGRLSVPGSVVQTLVARGQSEPSAALREVDRRSLVRGFPSVSDVGQDDEGDLTHSRSADGAPLALVCRRDAGRGAASSSETPTGVTSPGNSPGGDMRGMRRFTLLTGALGMLTGSVT